MDLTSGAILRRIIATPLSVTAHKLATIILDGTSWKDGYNGLERGTAAFTLTHLIDLMGISRQHMSTLLGELDASGLGLERSKPGGKFAPWIFRWMPVDNSESCDKDTASRGETSPLLESHNKTIFTGMIEIGIDDDPKRKIWLDLIKAAKRSLPCWNIEAKAIWDRFLAFNRAKGNKSVPAGFLLGFMRKWRLAPEAQAHVPERVEAIMDEGILRAQEMARYAPTRNRAFHQRDLERLIGVAAYRSRIAGMAEKLGLGRFTAALAVHGEAVRSGEIVP